MNPKIKPPIKLGIKKIVRNKLAPLNLFVTSNASPSPMTLIKKIATKANLVVNQIDVQNSWSFNSFE